MFSEQGTSNGQLFSNQKFPNIFSIEEFKVNLVHSYDMARSLDLTIKSKRFFIAV